MGWRLMECQPHGPPAIGCEDGLLMGRLLRLTSGPQQSIYICLPAPHIMEAYNHKVNHDTHKELNLQECVVLQYACTLQYMSFCNDARYKDCWAPAVQRLLGRGC